METYAAKIGCLWYTGESWVRDKNRRKLFSGTFYEILNNRELLWLSGFERLELVRVS